MVKQIDSLFFIGLDWDRCFGSFNTHFLDGNRLKNHSAALFCLSSALGVCGECNFHDIIFFLLVSLLENEISLGACKPNYGLIEGI